MQSFALCLALSSSCCSWSEGGHHLVAAIAFDELDAEQQSIVVTLLKHHPQFENKFIAPDSIRDSEKWLVGRAAFWPDLARKSAYDRPKWHYDVAIIGGERQAFIDHERVSGQADKKPAADITLRTRELNIKEAVQLCRGVLADKSSDPEDRAVALCWVCHLVGDSFQPCHTGSYYTTTSLPTGDRGGNEIPTKQGRNLHALWDGLLGPKFDEGDIARRAAEIRADQETWQAAKEFARLNKESEAWLEFSRKQITHVYSPRIVSAIETADRNRTKIKQVDLPQEYLQNAGRIAKVQATYAAAVLTECLLQIPR